MEPVHEKRPSTPIHGHVEPGFGEVADEFRRTFEDFADLGAALAVDLAGRPIVDLWGGVADSSDPPVPWRRSTLQLIFSGTKGLVAACLLMLVDRGLLRLSDRVCEHWPEFAANGKEKISVGEVVSHRARLPAIHTPLGEEDLTDDVRLAEILASQAPETDPRAEFVYHGLTYGWLCGELLRRIDGRPIGRFFEEEIANPLSLELWIGLPASEEARVSRIVYSPGWESNRQTEPADDPLLAAMENPPFLDGRGAPWNRTDFHAAEVPAVNAIGTARSVARFYACLANGGSLDNVRLMGPETVALGRTELSRFREPFSGEPLAYGAGFQLQTEWKQLGPSPSAFGHTGAGGSVHGAWPELRVGFSYAMNELRPDAPNGDPRSQRPLRALYRALNR